MPRILVIEKSPLVATDIVETVRVEFPQAEAMAFDSIEAAMDALKSPDVIDLCIVSGSGTRDRLKHLAALLDDRHVRTVAITDEKSKADIFAEGTVHLSSPFTSDMLIDAMRRLNRDARSSSRLSNPG